MSAVFVALQASIDPADRAVAASGLFLVIPVGTVIGMALSSAAMISMLRHSLVPRLVELGLSGSQVAEVRCLDNTLIWEIHRNLLTTIMI